jgi:hypothetical protein
MTGQKTSIEIESMFNIKTILGTIKIRVFSAEEKMQILREAEEHGATSTCRNHDVATSLFYKWKSQFNEKGIDGLQSQYYRVDPAITTSKGMVLNNVGSGSKYLGAYIDSEGNWLDGKNTYEIVVPKDAPANQFWSITVYDNDTRCIIQNEQAQSDISSVMDGLKVEDNGSVKTYVGPAPPDGYENNWVQSNPEKGFFVYLRLYGPLEAYYDRSWKMPDVQFVK